MYLFGAAGIPGKSLGRDPVRPEAKTSQFMMKSWSAACQHPSGKLSASILPRNDALRQTVRPEAQSL